MAEVFNKIFLNKVKKLKNEIPDEVAVNPLERLRQWLGRSRAESGSPPHDPGAMRRRRRRRSVGGCWGVLGSVVECCGVCCCM